MFERPPATVSPQIRGGTEQKTTTPLSSGVQTISIQKMYTVQAFSIQKQYNFLYTVRAFTTARVFTIVLVAIVLQVSFARVSSRKIWKIRVVVSLVFSSTYDTKHFFSRITFDDADHCAILPLSGANDAPRFCLVLEPLQWLLTLSLYQRPTFSNGTLPLGKQSDSARPGRGGGIRVGPLWSESAKLPITSVREH